MASHGRHILLDNVKQIAAGRRAKRGKGLEAPSGYRPPVFVDGAQRLAVRYPLPLHL